jgi:hypothetical protein
MTTFKGKSLSYTENPTGPRIVPCGTFIEKLKNNNLKK